MIRRSEHVPTLAALATVGLWSGSFLAIRDAVTVIDPVQLAAARFAIAGVAGLLWLQFAARVRPSCRDLPRIMVCGLIGIALYNVVLGAGEQHVSAGVAAFFVATQALFAALVSWLLEGERPTRQFALGCAVSVVGLILVTSRATLAGSADGIALCLASAFLSGTYFVIQRPLVAKLGPISSAAATMLAGALILLPWAPAALGRLGHEPALVFPVLYLAVLASVVAYSFWMVAIAGLGAARASQTLFLMAPATAAMEWVAGREAFSAAVAIGGAIAVFGIIIASGPRKRAAAATA